MLSADPLQEPGPEGAIVVCLATRGLLAAGSCPPARRQSTSRLGGFPGEAVDGPEKHPDVVVPAGVGDLTGVVQGEIGDVIGQLQVGGHARPLDQDRDDRDAPLQGGRDLQADKVTGESNPRRP